MSRDGGSRVPLRCWKLLGGRCIPVEKCSKLQISRGYSLTLLIAANFLNSADFWLLFIWLFVIHVIFCSIGLC
jgi:hypothetical protein